ncbi:MAG: DNA repair protein RadA [Planctomycetota bacterium]|nr:DNA repair protein RadA [Planctomycetota bacterium]
MAKARRVFLCRSCGSAHPRWLGKCPDCGTWDALEETTLDPLAANDTHKGIAASMAPDADTAPALAARIDEIDPEGEIVRRLPTGIGELDRVLGGTADNRGLVPGSVVLVGGEPGIGKSTLLLQAAYAWAASGSGVLYVTSEESAQQVALRSRRLRDDSAPQGTRAPISLHVLADTNLARIVEQARRVAPRVLVIDSVQMIYKPDVPAGPGSVTQLRRCAAELVYFAKASGVAVVLVGHVTKDGQLAGPRLLEHLVDCVLTFDGDRHHAHRVVRGVKNRFGTTLEVGLFEMTGAGLRPAPEGSGPAAMDAARPGSCVCPVLTGTRCLMVELQALTATGFLGAAKRKASGIDPNRLAMLIAVLEQHADLRLADRDVFASSVGGVRVVEPASDLALLLAIAGAHLRRALSPRTACVGEVGLGGEIRPVPGMEQRVHEAARLGYARLLCPPGITHTVRGLELCPVANVDRAIEHLT